MTRECLKSFTLFIYKFSFSDKRRELTSTSKYVLTTCKSLDMESEIFLPIDEARMRDRFAGDIANNIRRRGRSRPVVRKESPDNVSEITK